MKDRDTLMSPGDASAPTESVDTGIETGLPDGVVVSDAEDSKRGPFEVELSARNVLIAVAAVLLIVLILLLLYLLLLDRNELSTQVDRDPVEGLRAELVIEGPGTGKLPRFKQPMGAAWSPDGDEIFVADSVNNRICVFASTGRFLREFGGFGIAKPINGAQPTWDPGELNYPTDVAVDEDGTVFVADFYNDSISVFTPDGEFVRRFPDPDQVVGRGGSGEGGRGIAVTSLDVSDGHVYATDAYQVVVFTTTGEFVHQFGRPGAAEGELDRPNGIVVDPAGNVVVSDSNNGRVISFSPEGEFQWAAGGKMASDAPASGLDLVLPRGLALLSSGDFLVADPLGQHLARVTSGGKTVASYGRRGAAPSELNFPNDVDATADDLLLITDRENNRIQIARVVAE